MHAAADPRKAPRSRWQANWRLLNSLAAAQRYLKLAPGVAGANNREIETIPSQVSREFYPPPL